ncbi:hypothetical protein FPSE_07348 [Fusarium pseudograminearum CS3096]|uniref:HNH nuclease domain-containing protein n=1 Tax=Fusarium pseudograminearum (strain CS3096) TaxID=1028729 RepID=K3VE99_FUSPC|nr:hypothetical protein FPSE_07348 [Fusarium pseudograminearum CS3096]EKJ72467.1 hypothetical protein FPSE_07348 [Fusarium pseudograminearum CS3096]KAF0637698.1 hypothetical protein FPSE5266_07348 [Fusarium pseudograminearum]
MEPPAAPSGLQNRQSSQEIFDNSSLSSAKRRFDQIVNHFGSEGEGEGFRPGRDTYDRVKLVSLTYEHSANEKSKERLLASFFAFAGLPITSDEDEDEDIDFDDPNRRDELRASLDNFADYLVDNFFLPLKASTKKTPQPSPASPSAVMSTQAHGFAGSLERIANLRGACLIRDRYRCVVSNKYDHAEALKRFDSERHGQGEACDQDGQPLAGQRFDRLEVAHILPHSLTQLDSGGEIVRDSGTISLAILDMLDDGAADLIEGILIDSPGNALTLTSALHIYFRDLNIFFKPEGTVPHRYHVGTFLPPGFTDDVPVTRTFSLTEDNIDPPSPRLLAIHCAIGHILHHSWAGGYIDHILTDAEEYGIRHDGSTELHRLVGHRLNNWAGIQTL